ncbi:polysaccharide deacetylase family protein [Kaistella sp. DKR-2]|uniref:polysaccharide deacetylase family protein n=1 Tax=Kaistella soli TaxID=2849654 RepID=UPI001C271199|nr:polysaccharide deacetylase family protein [Kaistella soli]MBU8883089.1 polysaccharide deacetylase family protein [Kaistella soli]
MNAHYITAGVMNSADGVIFERFLKHLQKKSKLITLQEATALVVSKSIPSDESFVAFTFDDGFEECFEVIAPLLEKYHCNAGFFINANYVGSTESYQKQYHDRLKTFSKKPMIWKQIEDLHNRGHVIGSHTLDHFDLSDLNDEEIFFQLNQNKTVLEQNLNFKCDYFAWPYGQFKNFPSHALSIAKGLHPYIFSGTNYKRYFSMDGEVINRRHIEPFWSERHIDFFLSVNKKL